jgi:hypothetical protein
MRGIGQETHRQAIERLFDTCRDRETLLPQLEAYLLISIREATEPYEEALVWCSGAPVFAPGGEAHKGWEKMVQPLLQKAARTEIPSPEGK